MVSRLVGVSFQKLPVKEEGEGISFLSRLGEEGWQGDWIITHVIQSIWTVSFPFGPNVPISWNAPIWQGFLLPWSGNHHPVITAGYDRFQEFRNCSWHGGKHFHVPAAGTHHLLCKWSCLTTSPFYLVMEALSPRSAHHHIEGHVSVNFPSVPTNMQPLWNPQHCLVLFVGGLWCHALSRSSFDSQSYLLFWTNVRAKPPPLFKEFDGVRSLG